MSDKSESRATRRVLKSQEVIKEYLDRLDEGSAHSPSANARRSDRYEFRETELRVEIRQPGGDWIPYEVPSRNLSREGASFILGHFVHPGTACRIHLVSLQYQKRSVIGKIVRCRYLEGSGTLHEVGVSFEQPIDVAMFNQGAARLRFLLVDDDSNIYKIVSYWLRSFDVELMHAESGRKALEMVATAQFDLILLDLEMPELSGLDVARELRRRGFGRTIVMISANEDDETQKECLEAGCTRFMVKPLAREDIAGIVDTLKEEPLYSTTTGDDEFAKLVDEFVMQLPSKIGELEAAFARKDLEALGGLIRTLKGDGGAYGFQPITDAAVEANKVLGGTEDIAEIRAGLNDLIRVCLSARSAGADTATQTA